jgi:hypothetical protein
MAVVVAAQIQLVVQVVAGEIAVIAVAVVVVVQVLLVVLVVQGLVVVILAAVVVVVVQQGQLFPPQVQIQYQYLVGLVVLGDQA